MTAVPFALGFAAGRAGKNPVEALDQLVKRFLGVSLGDRERDQLVSYELRSLRVELRPVPALRAWH
jgi:hypothetical protein